ncbi:hypothetical protein [Sphingomonas bacterium]|uniref:hypothetical protein n=1 Tax=Sphingomonas bacterium TaxID=1895847 RepID=UPI0015751A1D|nr:hypothetical protein [Sphingomonas bacterium]
MKTEAAYVNITNRQFVATIRAKLDAGGHADVPVDRLWVDEDDQGYPFLLRVPVGAELIMPLMPLNGFFEADTPEKMDVHIGHFADALVNLRRGEKMLLRYVNGVRKAAVEVITAARADGLDLLLDRVGLKPAYAWHLAGGSWKDAISYVLAELRVRHTSFYLRPTVSEYYVEEAADVADEIQGLREEQRERQERLLELETIGADLEVDAITLDLLAAHGLDADQVLRDLWKRQSVTFTVQHLGR